MDTCFASIRNDRYSKTAIVTTFDAIPAMAIESGTRSPDGVCVGTCTFTWYRPRNPGARPENSTGLSTLPIVTVGAATVSDNGTDIAAEPVGGWFVTAPSPVQKIERNSPGRTGRAGDASVAVLATKAAP